ncbi:MAG: DEAD/DEAH box helicase [Desulfobacterales bacterium]
MGVTLTLSNHLYLRGLPGELSEWLAGELRFPNPKWLENERMGRWNRGTPKELRYYRRLRNGGMRIPRGYIRTFIQECRRREIPYELEDRRRRLPEVDFTFSGELKPFQHQAARELLAREFGTLSAPTGSGKTVIGLYLIARRRQPALIVVHTKDLAFQWIERIHQFLGIPEAEVGLIGGGKKSVGDRITVALVQSLYKHAATVNPKVGFLLVDECHRTPSRTFTDAVTAFDSRYMLGLSATPWRRDRLSKLIFWHLGNVHHQVSKTRLIASGDVLPAEVVVRQTGFRPYFDPVMEYTRMLSELTMDKDRNRLIAEDILAECKSSNGVCLVLTDRKAHCENLRAMLHYGLRLDAEVLTGDLGTTERRSIIERVRGGDVRVLIATGQLVGEGFDCPGLSTLFLATPIRFSGRLLQYLGRVLRPAPGKDRARVFDYVDVHVEPLVKAARARQRTYGE